MIHAITHIAASLKTAREARDLSQRALATRVGKPQGHLSRIEAGAVDLRLSSLIELARALDLELMLVPRQQVGAVKAVLRAAGRVTDREAALRAYRLDDDEDDQDA